MSKKSKIAGIIALASAPLIMSSVVNAAIIEPKPIIVEDISKSLNLWSLQKGFITPYTSTLGLKIGNFFVLPNSNVKIGNAVISESNGELKVDNATINGNSIKDNSLNGNKIQNGTLSLADLNSNLAQNQSINWRLNSTDLNFDNGTLMVKGANRNVGIGTTYPTNKLDVVGNARVTGTLIAGNIAGKIAGRDIRNVVTADGPAYMILSGRTPRVNGSYTIQFSKIYNTPPIITLTPVGSASEANNPPIAWVVYSGTNSAVIYIKSTSGANINWMAVGR